jgi:hypothetical protein
MEDRTETYINTQTDSLYLYNKERSPTGHSMPSTEIQGVLCKWFGLAAEGVSM